MIVKKLMWHGLTTHILTAMHKLSVVGAKILANQRIFFGQKTKFLLKLLFKPNII